MSDFHTRFGGIGRLYGSQALAHLQSCHLAVVGVGGVGSWIAEALARSGVGRITLIDLDEVCVSNVNRQLPALDGAFGRPKVEVMAERIRAIHPECRVDPRAAFFTASTAAELLAPGYDGLADAIDSVRNKCLLLHLCSSRSIPVVTTGGAGGRREPWQVRVADLAFTTHDPLLQEVRKRLRQDYGFPSAPRTPFGMDCVYSPEPVVYPGREGTVCASREPGTELALDCESGYGTASFVTGTFGFMAAASLIARVLRRRGLWSPAPDGPE